MKTGAMYWLNRPYACGAVIVDYRGVVIDACPIYRRLIGTPLTKVWGEKVRLP